ncbi:MAG: WD40 repeat domain-containing protein [candidate division WOR-3 bacterium]
MVIVAIFISQAVTALALSGDEKYLAVGFSDGFIRIYDPATGASIASRACHDDKVYSLDFMSDTLLSAGQGKIGVWCAEALGVAKALPVEPHLIVYSAFFRGDGKEVVSTDASCRIRLWDFRKRKLRKQLRYTGQDVNLVPACAAVSPDGQWFFIGYQGWTCEVWDLQRLEKVKVFDVWSPVKHYACAFSPDGNTLVFAEDCSVLSFRVGTWQAGPAIDIEDTVTALAFSPDGKTLFVGTRAGLVQAWREGKKLVETETGKERVNALAVGQFLYAGCDGGLVILPMTFREE